MSYVAPPQEEVDLFVVRIVVREGKYMPLNRAEQILAAQLLKKKGYSQVDVSVLLRVSDDLAGKFWKLKPPMPLDEVPGYIIGNLAVARAS